MLILIGCLLLFSPIIKGQESSKPFRFSGQVIGWGQYTPDISPDIWLGGRYIPQLNYRIGLDNDHLLDAEASANLFGETGFHPYNKDNLTGKIKPYRAWARYSSRQTEIRVGLQKINFGSAMMFRPLMWFDQMDPRDPLQLTDGVWGGLFRYYFLNNANFWFWVLYGNKGIKGWETIPVKKDIPETGARFQWPLSKGEMALSYHYRMTQPATNTSENRIGFDTKLNLAVGLWLEGSWTHLSKNVGPLTNQTMLTLGSDYTFDIGNGLAATFEQLVFGAGEKAFPFDNTVTFSGLSLSYPINLLDNLQAIVYYDWSTQKAYNFINWQRQYNHITLHLMGFWNPKTYNLPGQQTAGTRFIGKGVQFMIVWNY